MRPPRPPKTSSVPTRARRKTAQSYKFDDERRAKFLRALTEFGVVSYAAKAAGINPVTAYDHRQREPDFAAAWTLALESYADGLEVEAYRRAVKGVDEPVYQQGGKVGTIRRYSDSLLAMMLKGHRPDQYRDRLESKVEVSGSTGVLLVGSVPGSTAEWLAEQEKKKS